MRKRKRSGKRSAHQLTGHGCTGKFAWQLVLFHPRHRPPPKGWVLRAGPPALSGVFLPLFFLRRRRKNGAPGGRWQACLEEIRIRKPPTTAACKLARCVVSASEAASGLLTRPDDGCSHKLVWYPVQCAAAAPTPYAGGGFQRWGERPPPLVASFFPDSFFAIEERIGPPEGASMLAWKKLG